MNPQYDQLEPRNPGLVLLLSLATCGLYLIYWYWKFYEELEAVTGRTPTNFSVWIDLLLTVVTCGLYGVYVDYTIAKLLHEHQKKVNYPSPQDTTIITIVLDVFAYASAWITNIVTSAIHQDQLNSLIKHHQKS